MSQVAVIDTFPDFLEWWERAHGRSLEEQVEGWAAEYMAWWPELLTKQQEDYASQGLDWRQIARERVFPFLAERLPAMREAHQNMLEACELVYCRAREVLKFDGAVTFVIYVGIGCGAGWVTSLGGEPAILFGLENIAECVWGGREAVRGLVAHEMGHLVHRSWRAHNGKLTGSGSWWQLYEEGFAQYCETLLLGSENWHQAIGCPGWLEWCWARKEWLAAKFLRTVDAGHPVNVFFGSWFEIEGMRETGYFLGYEVIRELVKDRDLRTIALLENIEGQLRPILECWAASCGYALRPGTCDLF
ncbi:MAG: hypothetical protein N3B68_01630 [Anaerolineae bacterium]|nr:hypothetical protein [Anaerolineae bacterium]